MIKKSLMKKFIFVGSGLVLIIGCLFYLFLDAFHDPNFRTMQDKIANAESVDLTGLRDLRASGGFSVSYADIKKRLRHIKGEKFIVDGMSAFHGYIHGIPTTILGYHVSDPGLRHLLRRIIVTGTLEPCPNRVTDAHEEAKKYGFNYKNIKIVSKTVLSDANVDDIVGLFDSVPEDAWLHFHCHHGKGRTSTLLVMLDIMKNAPNVALKDIVKRQHLLGSTNLFDTEKWKFGTYSKELLESRKKFIEQFYVFVVQRKTGGIQRWSDWQRQQKNSGNT
jgi:hypothetical protein